MARIKDRQKAIELRKQGRTYGEIKRELGLPKSTLSGWLSKYPLTKSQHNLLKNRILKNKDIAVENFILTMRNKKEKRLLSIYNIERKKLLPLSRREIYFLGLFLYWGEGNKSSVGSISLSNNDPQMLKFFSFWLTKCLKIPKSKIKVYVHLYSDMDINKSLEFWGNELKIPLCQFRKPYIKISTRAEIDQKGFGHGTCNLVVNNVRLKEKMITGIRVISDFYSIRI